MTRTRPSRQASERRGRRAEFAAAMLLRMKGYSVLAKRVRLPVGEIDLIAKRGQTLAFIEVKYRRQIDAAFEAVSPSAWRRIHRAAELWASRYPHAAALDWRYDLIAVPKTYIPVHKPDFWRP